MSRATRAAKLTEAKKTVLRAVNAGFGCFLARKYPGGNWTTGLKKDELRTLLNSPGYLTIFKDDGAQEFQVVKYYSTPSGWPSEEVRYRVPYATL